MNGFAQAAGALFAEDFDTPTTEAVEAPAVEPVYSARDLAAAREAAWRDGHDAGLQEAATGDAAATACAVRNVAERFAAEGDAAAAQVEQSAEEIARLLLDSLAALFPTLCARYGEAEVRAIVRAVLPGLTQEPAITIRANPATAVAVKQEIARLDPELAAHVHLAQCDAMPPGDVRIAWHNGAATRDAAALWQEVAAILAPAGLLSADAAIRETVDAG
jgi:flagellar biosynthesis/type III secretory pathway protein FliH